MSKNEKKQNIPNLPFDQLPPDWQDESRLNVLYAPFRNKQVNPKDWDNKLEFWKQSIYTYCTHNKHYSFKLSNLKTSFTHSGRTPMCLSNVVEEMLKRNEVAPLHEFLTRKPNTWGSWATDLFIKKPVAWSMNKIKNTMFTVSQQDEIFVHVSAVQNHAKELLASLPETCKNRVIDLEELLNSVTFCDRNNLKLLIHHLESIGEASTREIEHEASKEPITLIKIIDVNKSQPINDMDVDIYLLQKTEKIILGTVEKLESDIVALTLEAKSYILKGQKQLAKNCLRKKRELERRIEARANALHNVQTLLSRMEDATQDTYIMSSYKLALQSLRCNFAENKLSEESVTNTMIEIGDALDIQNDIQAALSQPVSDTDADVEAELEELLATVDFNDDTTPKPSNTSPKSNTNITDLSEGLSDLNLPDVPEETPSLSTNTAVLPEI